MTQPNPIDALIAGARQYVADLSPEQFDQLVAETREPEQNPAAQGNIPKGGGAGRAQALAEAKRRGYDVGGQ